MVGVRPTALWMASVALPISARVCACVSVDRLAWSQVWLTIRWPAFGDVPGHARVVGHVLPDHREGRGDVVLLQDLEDLRGVDRARPVVDGERDRLRAVVYVEDRLRGRGAVGRGRGVMRVGVRGRVGMGRLGVGPVCRFRPGWGVRRAVVRPPPGVGVWSSVAAASFWLAQPTAPATPSIRPPLAISITRRDTAGASDRRWSPGFWVYPRIRREPPFLSRLLRRTGERLRLHSVLEEFLRGPSGGW